jgi:hypothetical protein
MTPHMKDGGSCVELPVQRYAIFRSFVGVEEQQLLVRESLQCHLKNSSTGINQQDSDGTLQPTKTDWNHMETSSTSHTFQLGVRCGGDLTSTLPVAVEVARRAFRQAMQHKPQLGTLTSIPALETLSQPNVPLAGLVLLYGLQASMPPHYDSPTQPGQREEWLVMMTMGNDVRFRCNDDIVKLQSGDVLVMDSMAVLHGVESIVDNKNKGCEEEDLGLPISSRLGILFWQGQSPIDNVDSTSISVVEGVGSLFPDSDDSDDDDE